MSDTAIRGCKKLVIGTSHIDDPVSVSVRPDISEGRRHEFRNEDGELILWDEPDILVGIELGFSKAVLDANVVLLIAGGSVSGGVYEAPRIDEQSSGQGDFFKAELYVSRYEAGVSDEHSVKDYLKITFPYCTGSAPSFQAAGRLFIVPEFTIYAHNDLDEYGEVKADADGPYSLEFVDNLPS